MVETKTKYGKLRLECISTELRYRSFGRWPQTILFTDNDIIEGSRHFWATWIKSPFIPAHGPHFHNDSEELVFLGSDPENPKDLGCEVEFCMGMEMEKHVFHESTLVFVPAGLVHGPVKFQNFKRPFIFIQANRAPKLTEEPVRELVSRREQSRMVFFDFDGRQTASEVQKQLLSVRNVLQSLQESPESLPPANKAEKPRTGTETQYGRFFLNELSPPLRQQKSGKSPNTIVFTDDDIIKGSNLFLARWRRRLSHPGFAQSPHSHNNPEALVTLGSNPYSPLDAGVFGVDYMGEEMEKYGSCESNLIFLPAGLVHVPQRELVYQRPWIMVQCQYAPRLSRRPYKKSVK
jgi:hypothetical protein